MLFTPKITTDCLVYIFCYPQGYCSMCFYVSRKNIDPVSADNSEQADHQQDWQERMPCYTLCICARHRRDETQLENKKAAKWKGQGEVIPANQLFNLQLNTQVTKNPSSHTQRSPN